MQKSYENNAKMQDVWYYIFFLLTRVVAMQEIRPCDWDVYFYFIEIVCRYHCAWACRFLLNDRFIWICIILYFYIFLNIIVLVTNNPERLNKTYNHLISLRVFKFDSFSYSPGQRLSSLTVRRKYYPSVSFILGVFMCVRFLG